MKKIILNRNVKVFISIVVAVSVGNFFTDILYRIDSNVWMARIVGCGICAFIGGLFYYLWIPTHKRK